MISLGVLILHETSISGTLPPEWANMSSLQRLYLFQTSVNGTIPPTWANMKALKQLDLSSTLLSGDLPSSLLMGMASLVSVQVASTLLGGTLPELVPEYLSLLDISGCNFSGSVPCYRSLSSAGVYLYADSNNMINSLPFSGPCGFRGLSVSGTSITSLPKNFSAVFPDLSYLAIAGLPLTELPPIADVSGIIIEASDNVLDLSSLDNLSFSNAQSLDFTPRYEQDAVKFAKMCRGNCSVIGSYSAQRPTCSSQVTSFLCLRSDQALQLEYSSEFADGNFLSPVRFALRDLSGTFPSGFVDLSCPSNTSATLVPTLRRMSRVVLPSYSSQVAEPSWNATPISFPSSGVQSWLFSGMQTAQLLHGVQYQLVSTAFVHGSLLSPVPSCDPAPHVYSQSTSLFTLAPCSGGLLGLNYTQRCVVCPALASCDNTRIFAAAGTHVWRPSFDVLPFYRCKEGTRGCYAAADLSRVGSDCAVGYRGPRCGECIEGYGRTGSGDCAVCYSTSVNFVVVVLAVLFAFCVVTYVVIATTSTNVTEDSKLSVVALGQQAVKLLTNHFSLFAILVNTTIATTMSSELMATLVVQQTATSPSPTQNTFASCLLPNLTANDIFVVVLIVVLALVVVEIVIVRIVRNQWAIASVSAAVLQLLYLNVIAAASSLLQHVPMTFYDSTNYMSGNTTSAAVLPHLSLDVLDADVRIDFRTNTGYYIAAWLVLVGLGVGVPVWFAAAFRLLERNHSTEEARQKLKFLVDNYKPSAWYWESIVAARKGLSVGLVAALASFPVLQLQAIMLLFAGYLVLEEHFDPFLSDRRRAAERASYAAALVTCNAMLAAYSVGDELFTTVLSALMIATQIGAVIVFGVVISLDYKRAIAEHDDRKDLDSRPSIDVPDWTQSAYGVADPDPRQDAPCSTPVMPFESDAGREGEFAPVVCRESTAVMSNCDGDATE